MSWAIVAPGVASQRGNEDPIRSASPRLDSTQAIPAFRPGFGLNSRGLMALDHCNALGISNYGPLFRWSDPCLCSAASPTQEITGSQTSSVTPEID